MTLTSLRLGMQVARKQKLTTVEKATNGSDVPTKAPVASKKHVTKKAKLGKARNAKAGAALRSLPSMPFQDALAIGEAIQKFAGGQEIRRLTLFQHMGKGADSSLSRALVTNSAKYGITVGNHSAEKLRMTPDGVIASNPEAPARDRFRARAKFAIEAVPPFNALYERFQGKMPSQEVMRDFLIEEGYDKSIVPQLVDCFILNAKFLSLLQEIAGAERLLPIDHVLEEIERANPSQYVLSTDSTVAEEDSDGAERVDFDKTCFYVSPIGDPESSERRHADLFLSQVVEPALQEFGMKVVRADAITEPGMVTRQVLEYAVRARLVIADLSFQNGSVLYEVCLRHVVRKPIVHIIQHGDNLPFDVNQFRTITIDNRNIYTLLPKLETYRAEIANQTRRALEEPDSVESPISTFFPGLKVTVPP